MGDKQITPVLVTGARGFIGRELVQTLAHKGIPGIRAVRFFSEAEPPPGWIDIATGDISGVTDWSDVLEDVDVIVHLAACVHRKGQAASWLKYHAVNVEATENLARQAAKAGVRRFVFLSSVKVFGESTNGREPFSESDEPDPQDDYAVSKMMAENALMKITSETDMQLVIVRAPLVYGPHVKGNLRVLIRWIRLSLPMPFADVNNKRTLVALDNVVDLICVCMNHPEAANRLILATDIEDVSTPQLLNNIGHALNKTVYLFPVSVGLLKIAARILSKEDVFTRLCGSLQIDGSRTRKILGWFPSVSMNQQLRKLADENESAD